MAGPGGQIVNKCGHIIISFVAPILLDIETWLPYVVAGGAAMSFTLYFIFIVKKQYKSNERRLSTALEHSSMYQVSAKALKSAVKISFTTLEALSRLASSYLKQEDSENSGSVDNVVGEVHVEIEIGRAHV